VKFPKRQNKSFGGGDGPKNFLRIKDGEDVVGMLRGEVYPFYAVGFGQDTRVVGPGEGGKERFRHNFIVKEGGKYVAKIWEFGPKIYDTLGALESGGWDLQTTMITISRTGSTKENTRYTVTPIKKEPSALVLKEIEALPLNMLEHRESLPMPTVKNYAPGADDEEPPF
jgi:hypothetical protein